MTSQPSSRRPIRFPETKPLLIALAASAFGAAAMLGIVDSWPTAGSEQAPTGRATTAQVTGAPVPFVEGASIDLGGPVIRGPLDNDGSLEKPIASESVDNRIVHGLLDTEGPLAIDSANSLPAERTHPVNREARRGHITIE